MGNSVAFLSFSLLQCQEQQLDSNPWPWDDGEMLAQRKNHERSKPQHKNPDLGTEIT